MVMAMTFSKESNQFVFSAFSTVCEDGGDSWRYSYRPCCETLFLTVFHEHRTVLSPMIVEMAHASSGPVSPQDLRGLLHKDAIYNAVGLAAFDLYDEVSKNLIGPKHNVQTSELFFRLTLISG